MSRVIRPWAVTLIFLLAYVGIILARHNGDPMSLVLVGSRFAGETPGVTPVGPSGYDGQFAYYIALDPVHPAGRLDVPAYRYQRILYPLLARALSLGLPALLPWAMLVVNLAAQAAGTAILEALLIDAGVSRWYALAYGLWAGLAFAVRLDLNEPLSYGLVAAAYLAQRRNHPWWTAGWLTLAVLAKETALIFVVAQIAFSLFNRDRRSLAALGLLTLAPLAAFQFYLYSRFGSLGLTTGGDMATSFEIVPFMGVWRIGTVRPAALLLFLVFLAPLVMLPSVWGMFTSIRRLLARDFHPYVFALAANAGLIPFTPFSTFREPLAILRFATGLVMATLLFGAYRRSRRTMLYSQLWLAALVFLVKE
ncbi:MAG: hypothetical protein HY023_17220 [Chloroflexi bacterium]|nr:hypothetical protein [Chloroflexota bacterium]